MSSSEGPVLSSRHLRWYDALTINANFFGLTTLSQTMTPLVIPLLVQQFVGVGRQGAYYGNIRLWSLMTALLVQSLMGSLSDRCTSRWGRRRPFIFVGTLGIVVTLLLVGLTVGIETEAGYWILFIIILLMMVASNTSQGAQQGLIPDLVPVSQRGAYSGVKALLEAPLPIIVVSLIIGRSVAQGRITSALLTVIALLLLAMMITMFAPEKRLHSVSQPINLTPFLRLVLMTALFTGLILGTSQLIRWAGRGLSKAGPGVALNGMGVLGLLGMLLVIGAGVYFSVGIGLGAAAQKNTSFTWWVINRLAFLVGSTNIASFALYFIQTRLRLPGEQAAEPTRWLLLVVGVFILLIAPLSGWLADRIGHKKLVAISGLTAALGTLVIVATPSLSAIYIGGILIGTGAGMFFTANWALGTALVPSQEAGRYLGISNLAGAGAGAVGAYIGGPIADFFTIAMPKSPGIGYVLLYAIYGLLFLASVLALVKIKPAQGNRSVSV
jgi:MFS family permease